jgi:ribosomal protein S16
MKTNKVYLIVLFFLSIFLNLGAQEAGNSDPVLIQSPSNREALKNQKQNLFLFTKSDSIVDAQAIDYYLPINRAAVVEINKGILKSKPGSVGDNLTIKLFGDVYQSVVDRVNININGTLSIRSRFKEYEHAYLILSVTENEYLAFISIPELDKKYAVQTNKQSEQVYLYELDNTGFAEFILEPRYQLNSTEIDDMETRSLIHAEKANAIVDVMIIYTPAARNWANNSGGGISNVIAQSMEKSLLALNNSNTLMTMNLVYSAEVNYSESPQGSEADLNNLTTGTIQNVHEWRNTYGADLVQMFTFVEDTGGLGWLLNNYNGTPSQGFSLTRVQQASSTFTVIHEWGHNMGAHHHKDQNTQPGPTIWTNWPGGNTWSAGWRWQGSDNQMYCDLMTYESGQYFPDNRNAIRLPYFSNPNINYLGLPVGHAAHGDNARTIREIRNVVAAYNSASSTYTITTTSVPSNGGTTTGDGTFPVASNRTVTATPNDGFIFLYWTEGGNVVSTDQSYTFVLNSNRNLEANFSRGAWINITDTTSVNKSSIGIVYNPPNNPPFQGLYIQMLQRWQPAAFWPGFPLELEAIYFELDYWRDPRWQPNTVEVLIYDQNLQTLYTSGQYTGKQGGNEHKLSAPFVLDPTKTYYIGISVRHNEREFPCVYYVSDKPVPNNAFIYRWRTAEGNWTNILNFSSNVNPGGWAIELYVSKPKAPEKYTITTSSNPSNGGSTSGGGTFEEGTEITVVASPNAGFAFSSWTENGVQQTTNPNYSFVVTKDLALVANFQPVSQNFTISAFANPIFGGSVSGSGSYSLNQTAQLVATPNMGFSFQSWTENGVVVSTNQSYSFTVTTNRTLVANFIETSSATCNWFEWHDGIHNNYIGLTQGGRLTAAAKWEISDLPGNQLQVTKVKVGVHDLPNYAYIIIWQGNQGQLEEVYIQEFYPTAYNDNEITLNTPYAVDPSKDLYIGWEAWHSSGSYPFSIDRLKNPNNKGDILVLYDGSQNIEGTANLSDYNIFGDWLISACIKGSASNYTINTSSNPNFGGTTTGSGTFAAGTNRTVTASPNAGFSFVNWTENGIPVYTNPTYSFILNNNRTLVANFQVQSFNISATANPANGGTITGAGNYNLNQTATLSANPNQGFSFINWTENGVQVSTSPNYSFTVTGNRTLVANFHAETTSFNISATANPANGGIISGAGTYNLNQTATLSANPNQGFSFINWTENGVQVSTSPNYSFTVTGNRTLVANFHAETTSFNISATANPANGGIISGVGTYNLNQTATLSANPNQGFSFVNWTENGVQVSTSPNYSFTVTGNRTLVANFHAETTSFNISATANPANGGIISGAGTYNLNQTATLSANPNQGFSFVNWTENGVQVSTSPSYSFTVAGNRTLEANFHAETTSFNISATANPANGGTITGAGVYQHNQMATLSAIANAGFSFVNWTDGGIQVSTNPNYTFIVTNDRTLVANFTITTSVTEFNTKGTVTIFPNPNLGQFTLKINNSYLGEIKISIHSASGANIKEFRIIKTEEEYSETIEMYNVPAGLYYLNMITDKGKILRTIIVK